MMVMQKLFFLLVVLSCTHKQAHIVHINTHTKNKRQKKTKTHGHLDKSDEHNTCTRKNHIHLNRENNDGDIKMFFIPHFVLEHT